jgi:hypothetical protein
LLEIRCSFEVRCSLESGGVQPPPEKRLRNGLGERLHVYARVGHFVRCEESPLVELFSPRVGSIFVERTPKDLLLVAAQKKNQEVFFGIFTGILKGFLFFFPFFEATKIQKFTKLFVLLFFQNQEVWTWTLFFEFSP